MISVEFVSEAKKFLKKCPSELKELFKAELSAIYEDIEAGIALSGDLIGCYKFVIDYNDESYRAVYEILSEYEVKVVYCGPRKNAYPLIKKSKVLGKVKKRTNILKMLRQKKEGK